MSIAKSAIYDSPFTPGLYNPPHLIPYDSRILIPISVKFVPITIPHAHMKYVIGKNGYYFNAITHASNIAYIWYHSNLGMVELRGPHDNLNEAERRIIARMNHISKSVAEREQTKNKTDIEDDCKENNKNYVNKSVTNTNAPKKMLTIVN
jgi:hypothetical protein